MLFVAATFWDYFWGFVTVMLGVSLLVLWVYLFVDILMRPGISAVGRVLWIVLLFVLPWIGGFIYLMVRPYKGEYSTYFPTAKHEKASEESFTKQMDKLVTMHDRGKLSDAEFAAAKAKLLV